MVARQIGECQDQLLMDRHTAILTGVIRSALAALGVAQQP
jgi:hypothetical protein